MARSQRASRPNMVSTTKRGVTVNSSEKVRWIDGSARRDGGSRRSPPPGCTPAVGPRRWRARASGGTMNTEERDASVDHERHPTTWWTRLDDGRVRCDVCPRACALHEDQTGLCFVRMRAGDRIVLTTYGRSSGSCVDPIEKKPLNHFLPGTPVLSFGTAGCNLS